MCYVHIDHLMYYENVHLKLVKSYMYCDAYWHQTICSSEEDTVDNVYSCLYINRNISNLLLELFVIQENMPFIIVIIRY